MEKFDAIIIGSGQAGTPLVFRLAEMGKSIAFIEKNKLGGTCLNIGCTPTKAYVASARRMWDAKHGNELGISIPAGTTANLKEIKKRKDELISSSREGIASGLDSMKNVSFFQGEATFIGKKQVQVGEQILSSEQIFINVGGRAHVPDAYQLVPYFTNASILELEVLPKHLIIVGGSYIGLEFGQIFSRLGSKVTIIEKGSHLLPREDKEVGEIVKQALEADGVEFRLHAECLSADKNGDGNVEIHSECSINGKFTIQGTHLLLGVGRRPNTETLDLEKTGVLTNSRGYIEVNDQLETNVPGIYALGDCNGKGAFTHTAYNDFEIVFENLFEGKDRRVSDRIMTYGLFVDPPLGRVGMTKEMAKKAGYQVLEGRREMNTIARAKEKGETLGFISVLVDKHTKKILGATILGVGGDEIVSGIVNIMNANCSYEVIRDAVVAHPTVSELIPTLLEDLKPL